MLTDSQGRNLWIADAFGGFAPVRSHEDIRNRAQDDPDWWVVARDRDWTPPEPGSLLSLGAAEAASGAGGGSTKIGAGGNEEVHMSTKFWRRLSFALAFALVLCLVQLHLHTGYPKRWNEVQVGMTISQVRALCGPPTHNNAGMKPDQWDVPFLLGAWRLKVAHGEIGQGPQSVTGSKEIDFYFNGFQNPWVKIACSKPPILDFSAYYKAFGQELKPEP